jgi:hypothetical protein
MEFLTKMNSFQNLDDLISALKLDKTSSQILSRRYPVRLIFLQRFEAFRQLIIELSSFKINVYNLETALPNLDGWITNGALYSIVRQIEGDTVIVPFSELVRFYDAAQFSNFFHNVMLIENENDLSKRIYLPLIGIEQRFEKDFFQSFSRKFECAPIWSLEDEAPNSIKVYLTPKINFDFIPGFQILPNTDEWLKFWKTHSPCDVISASKALNLYYKNALPDSIFSIEKISNQKELFEKIYSMVIPIQYSESESEYWDKLASLLINKHDDFYHLIKNQLKVTSINVNSALSIWLSVDNLFSKWLLKHFICSQKCLQHTYLFAVFSKLEDYTDHTLLKHLYLNIFSIDASASVLDERFELIKQFYKNKSITLCPEVLNEIEKNINSISDNNIALQVLTGYLDFEKILILNLALQDKKYDNTILKQRYPHLAYYLSPTTFSNVDNDQVWIYDYLRLYKKSKLNNKIDNELKDILDHKNKNQNSFYEWYHSFRSIHSLLHTHKVDSVIWFDAVGIEWVSFFENYIANLGVDFQVKESILAAANLPTSTEHNRFEGIKHILDYDNFIHQKQFSYPESIINEFSIIASLIEKHIALNTNQTIAIVSDHGLTALSRLVDSKKYGKNDSHEGRYIPVDNGAHSEDSDYITHLSDIDDSHYLIALKHNSLGTKPVREVHGGCTPEEIFVPIIIVSNKKEISTSEYSIDILNTEILKKIPILSFRISPKPSSVLINIAGKKIKLINNIVNDTWDSELDKALSGELEVKVTADKTEKKFIINIITGLTEEELF